MRRLILTAIAVMLSSCGPTIKAPETSAKFYRIAAQGAFEFKLDDGTRCVAWDSGGIVCQWDRGVE